MGQKGQEDEREIGMRESVQVGRRSPKRIEDGDGKPWTVERRPLGSALSRSIAATEQEGRRIPSVLAYGFSRISKTELNTTRGHRGTEEITSEFVKWLQIRRLNYLHASLPTPSNRRSTPAFVRKLASSSQSANVGSSMYKEGFIAIKLDLNISVYVRNCTVCFIYITF